METTITDTLSLEKIYSAQTRLSGMVEPSPLQKNEFLSERYQANIFLKREDLQVIRSFKIRGAYNKISSLGKNAGSVVCASAGNHAQGVALSCALLGIKGTIFMPLPTPHQKVQQVQWFGKDLVEVRLVKDTFDDCCECAKAFAAETGGVFIHPFDDEEVIAGQGTVGLEMLKQAGSVIDFLFIPIGGGGLAAGVSAVFKTLSPSTRLIGVEPEGAASMQQSLRAGRLVALEEIDRFADGAAVKQAGALTFEICKDLLEDVLSVPEGKICSAILELYNRNAIIAEPAGALSVAALDYYRKEIRGKNVVCIVSGGNNDIGRMEEIKERSLVHEGIKHHFLISFPQRAGALKEFVNSVLGEGDDITRFEFLKKNNREKGPVLIGIELQHKEELGALQQRMEQFGFPYTYIQPGSDLFGFLL